MDAPAKHHQSRWSMCDILAMGVVVDGTIGSSYTKTMRATAVRQGVRQTVGQRAFTNPLGGAARHPFRSARPPWRSRRAAAVPPPAAARRTGAPPSGGRTAPQPDAAATPVCLAQCPVRCLGGSIERASGPRALPVSSSTSSNVSSGGSVAGGDSSALRRRARSTHSQSAKVRRSGLVFQFSLLRSSC